jgi:hypothetical protein
VPIICKKAAIQIDDPTKSARPRIDKRASQILRVAGFGAYIGLA